MVIISHPRSHHRRLVVDSIEFFSLVSNNNNNKSIILSIFNLLRFFPDDDLFRGIKVIIILYQKIFGKQFVVNWRNFLIINGAQVRSGLIRSKGTYLNKWSTISLAPSSTGSGEERWRWVTAELGDLQLTMKKVHQLHLHNCTVSRRRKESKNLAK